MIGEISSCCFANGPGKRDATAFTHRLAVEQQDFDTRSLLDHTGDVRLDGGHPVHLGSGAQSLRVYCSEHKKGTSRLRGIDILQLNWYNDTKT